MIGRTAAFFMGVGLTLAMWWCTKQPDEVLRPFSVCLAAISLLMLVLVFYLDVTGATRTLKGTSLPQREQESSTDRERHPIR